MYLQKDKRKRHVDCYRYEVANRKDLGKIIIPFFKKNKPLFNSKRKDFKLFSQIMEIVGKNKHLKDSGLRRIYRLKKKMH